MGLRFVFSFGKRTCEIVNPADLLVRPERWPSSVGTTTLKFDAIELVAYIAW